MGGLKNVIHGFADWQRATLGHNAGQVLAIDKLHYQEVNAVGFPRVEGGGDVGMNQSRRRLDFFRKTRSFDIGKARRELDFDPRTSLETGFRKTIEWYRHEGLIK